MFFMGYENHLSAMMDEYKNLRSETMGNSYVVKIYIALELWKDVIEWQLFIILNLKKKH